MSKSLTSAVQEGAEGSIAFIGGPPREWRTIVEVERGD